MDITRYRYQSIKLALLLYLFLFSTLFAHYNQDFLENSHLLTSTLDSFHEENYPYKSYLNDFQKFKDDIKVRYLDHELSLLSWNTKENFFKEDYVVKKRPRQNINESFFWEISIILSLSQYVTPSYPVEIGDHLFILQPIEEIEVASYTENLPSKRTKQVSHRDYFYAHILAFLLGAQDLSGMNIGLTEDHSIRFFDNEDIFNFDLTPHKTSRSYFAPFVSLAFDWPQYRMPLKRRLAKELKKFLLNLNEKKEALECYATIRGLPEETLKGIYERIAILNGYEFEKGSSFADFIHYLHPKLSDGLDDLSDIVSEILQRKVDHGVALFFTTKMIHFVDLTSPEWESLNSWISLYIQ